MRKLVLAGLTCIGLLGFELPAAAQSDCKTRAASPFGPDDQTGATNRVTPAVTKAAAAEIQDGKVISTDQSAGRRSAPVRLPLHQDGVDGGRSRAWRSARQERSDLMEDTWLSQSHVGTHLDGMGHIGRLDCYYNQTPWGNTSTRTT